MLLVFLLLTPPREYNRESRNTSPPWPTSSRAKLRRGLLAARTPEEVLETINQANRPPPSVVALASKRAPRGA